MNKFLSILCAAAILATPLAAAAWGCFIGEYTAPDDGSTLQICKTTGSGAGIKISLLRLTDIDDGIGKIANDTLTFTATDAAGNPIKGRITLDGDTATVVFTESTWEYLPDGTAFHFKRDAALLSRAYPLTNASAGPFRIGAAIQDSIVGFEIEKSTEIKTVSEGMTIEIPIYTYYIGNEGWVRVTPQYDTATGLVSNNIGEIYVYSDLFLTDKCIGAISSLKDFASVYTDLNILYIDEEDMFAVRTPQLPDVQFLLSSEHYIGTEHDPEASPYGKLNVSDFEEKSHFEAIRICHRQN